LKVIYFSENSMVGELKGRAGKPWTDYENSILTAMGNGGSRAIAIAQRLDHPTAVVRKRAAELGMFLLASS
jgi:hypothetical protein